MFGRLFSGKSARRRISQGIYGALVTMARNPVLFAELGVPDTINGRYDMMVMHVFLFAHRMKDQDATCRALSQDVFDAFLLDMDRGLREEGVGDISVPKRIKKMTEVFYGRVRAYEPCLEAQNLDQIALVVDRNVFPDNSNKPGSLALASYMLRLQAHLKSISNAAILRGELALETVDPITATP